MMKAKEAAEEASDETSHLGSASGFARYHWNHNEIDINLNVWPVLEIDQPSLTHALCKDIRRAFIGELSLVEDLLMSMEDLANGCITE